MSNTYNPDTMPTNLAEWNELVTFKTSEAQAKYDTAVAAAKAQAEAAYQTLPDDEHKPTLADYIAQATASIPQPESRADFEQMYACYYPQPAPEPEPEPTPEQLFEQLRSIRDQRLAATDYLLMPDYPIAADKLAAVKVYREALRDLPAQAGAPWDGGGSQTPWPTLEI